MIEHPHDRSTEKTLTNFQKFLNQFSTIGSLLTFWKYYKASGDLTHFQPMIHF